MWTFFGRLPIEVQLKVPSSFFNYVYNLFKPKYGYLLETNARSLRVILGEKITFSWYHENSSFRVQYFNQHYLAEMDAMRASGLIPVNPIIVINKDTQLPMYIVEQAIIYWRSGWIHHSYLYQPDNIHYVLYFTKYEQGSWRPSLATRGGRATGIISEIWYYLSCSTYTSSLGTVFREQVKYKIPNNSLFMFLEPLCINKNIRNIMISEYYSNKIIYLPLFISFKLWTKLDLVL